MRRRLRSPRVGARREAHGVGVRTLRGMFWAYGSYVGGRVLVLVSVAILAHVLAPSEFGLVGFALTVTALLDTISDLGVGQALVVANDDEQFTEKASTAWTISVLLGLGLTLLTVAVSPLAADFFHDSALTPLLAVLGLNFLLRGAGATHFAIAQKEIDFRTRTAAELADVLVRGSTGVALALAGAGAWSLVIGYLAGTAAMTTFLWILVPFRPRLQRRLPHVGGLVRFGGALTVLDVLGAVTGNVDYVLVGRVLGAADLGLYLLGFRMPELLIMNLSLVAGLVLFPAFAGVSRHRVPEAFLTSFRYMLMVTVPLTVGLVVLAKPLTLAAFGEQWRDSIPAMRVLSLFAFAVTIGIPAGTVYKSLGRLNVLIALAVPRTILAVVTIAIFVHEGIVAVAACQAVVAGTFALIGIGLATRLLSANPRHVLGSAWPSLAAGVVMAGMLALPLWTIDSPWIVLAVGIPLGALAYLGALWLLAADSLRYLWATAFPADLRTATSTPDSPGGPSEGV
jgi:O-antigen/teichoic acid export membrane protein